MDGITDDIRLSCHLGIKLNNLIDIEQMFKNIWSGYFLCIDFIKFKYQTYAYKFKNEIQRFYMNILSVSLPIDFYTIFLKLILLLMFSLNQKYPVWRPE